MVRAVVDGGLSQAAVARLYRTTAKTVGKWVERFCREGVAGLRDRSSKPLSSPSQTPLAICSAVEALRRQRHTGKHIAAQVGVCPATVSRILLLGGTAEAAALAQALIDRFGDKIALTNSLAGRTPDPAHLPGDLRVGGFGGVLGLTEYLRGHAINLVIDVTHPFAAQISANAAAACAETGIPCLHLDRPPWPKQTGDHWIEAANTKEAAAILEPLAQRIWLTTGNPDHEKDQALFAELGLKSETIVREMHCADD